MPLTLQETETKLVDAVTLRVSQQFPTLVPDLQIAAEDGIITASGSLSTHTERSRITQVIRNTPGVRAVVDRLDMPSAGLAADWMLAKNVAAELAESRHLDNGNIQVTVRGGIVVLDGTVRWNCSRISAGACIADLPGLKGVCNRLKLERES